MVQRASQSRFAMIPSINRPRSAFDRQHGFKSTFDAGYLVPCFVDEALPGDTINLRMTAFARLATPLHPFMDNMYLSTFFFAVPMRLIWNNFQKFMGEQVDPGDSTDYTTPKMTSPASTGYAIGSLSDYFGLPTGVPGYEHRSCWHRAYNLIFNEWFRDQNLQDSVVVDKDDGPDDPADYVLLRRGKRHDYFTSALPFPQKGDAVTIPLTGNAPVTVDLAASGAADLSIAYTTGTGSPGFMKMNANGTMLRTEVSGGAGTGVEANSLYGDLSTVTAATINQLREAVSIQQLLELDARGGTRYTEIVLAHFGVRSPDARLQRPEYLGGGRSYINVSPVAQMSETTDDSPQGNLAAIGTGTIRGHGFTKSFTEHCVLIGLVCAHADLNYQQGLNRMFSRDTRYDFYWPTLANLGEQAVLNKEIYVQGTGNPTEDAAAFGYQERWAEYRYKPNVITGLFRSTAAQSLDTWHLAQEFGALPTLNDTFIVENPPVERVIAVETEPHFLFDSHFQFRHVRPMPTYSVPGLTRF